MNAPPRPRGGWLAAALAIYGRLLQDSHRVKLDLFLCDPTLTLTDYLFCKLMFHIFIALEVNAIEHRGRRSTETARLARMLYKTS